MSKLTPSWQKASVLESVFDQLSDALVLYDPEFRITGVNRAAEKLFGMSLRGDAGQALPGGLQMQRLRARVAACWWA